MSSLALGEVIQLQPVKDNTLYENVPDNSNGAGKYLFIGQTGEDNGIPASFRRALLQFDVSGIPANAVIENVQVAFTINKVPSIGATSDFATLHRVLQEWGEGTSNAPGAEGQGITAQPGDATWNDAVFNTDSWGEAGGDFEGSASAITPFGVSEPEAMTFASTPGLVADVQGWVKNPANNFGWILKGDEITIQNARRMASREHVTDPVPVLAIEFTVPPEVDRGTATFEVNKVFGDGSPGDATVTLTCNSGLPLEQSFVISEGNGVTFVVAGLVSGASDCNVSETLVDGYTGSYFAAGDSSNSTDSSGCHYDSVESGDSNTCRITNDPDPVRVDFEKEWIYASSDEGDIISVYVLTLFCDAEIVGGTPKFNGGVDSPDSLSDIWFKVFNGSGSETFTALVIPEYPLSHCWVDEQVFSDAVETDNGCRNIVVSVGNPAACKITNSVFFEGIPTLSQYGLAIMALLMLAMGLLGFKPQVNPK